MLERGIDRAARIAADSRRVFVIDKEQLMDWDPKDYPATDTQSQKAPGGSLHTQALADFRAGSDH